MSWYELGFVSLGVLAEGWDLRAWTSELGLVGTYELGLVGAFELGFGTCELGPRTSSNRSQRQRKTYRALSVEPSKSKKAQSRLRAAKLSIL